MSSVLPPSEICGYRVLRALAPGKTFLAIEEHGREVVLKKLEEDCLLAGQLHPDIKDRLGRVREVPHLGCANLFGVERDSHGVFGVWEYIRGEDFSSLKLVIEERWIELVRETVLAVQALHHHGLVHGAIKCGNVIVDEFGHVRLTHLSPLLYSDPVDDERSLLVMLAEVEKSRETPGSISKLLARVPAQGDRLNWLASEIAGLKRQGRVIEHDPQEEKARISQRQTWVSAVLVMVLGIAMAVGVWLWVKWNFDNGQ